MFCKICQSQDELMECDGCNGVYCLECVVKWNIQYIEQLVGLLPSVFICWPCFAEEECEKENR